MKIHSGQVYFLENSGVEVIALAQTTRSFSEARWEVEIVADGVVIDVLASELSECEAVAA